jgi:hypothetical protein
MTRFATTALLAAITASAPAADSRFDWVISAGGKLHDKVRGLAVDPTGNIFVTGEFTGEAAFGDFTLKAAGSMDFFVAKVSPLGKFLWVRAGGGAKIDRGYAVAVDDRGNCVVTGHFESSDAVFGSHKPALAGEYDAFAAKYDANGEMAWFHSFGGKGYDYGHGVGMDGAGNAVVTGALAGAGIVDGRAVGESGPSRIFCIKFDPAGKVAWTRVATGAGSSNGHGIAVDRAGNSYLGGAAGGAAALAGLEFRKTPGRDILVAKLDPSGKAVWIHDGFGSDSAMVHEICADETGRVWVSGMFKGKLKTEAGEVAGHGDSDLLVASFDSSGKRAWTRVAGGPRIDYGLGVTTDGGGYAFLTGSFSGKVRFGDRELDSGPASDIFVAGLDSNGQFLWLLQPKGKATDHAYTIGYHKGLLYLSGACSGEATFGDKPVSHRGSNDIFLARVKLAP